MWFLGVSSVFIEVFIEHKSQLNCTKLYVISKQEKTQKTSLLSQFSAPYNSKFSQFPQFAF